MTPGEVEAFCLTLPGAAPVATEDQGQLLAVAARPFAVVTPGGGLRFRCTDAAGRLLRARPGVVPCPAPDGGAGSWVELAGVDAIEAEELLDYLRLAYGLAVAGLPEAEREPLLAALRRPMPPTRH